METGLKSVYKGNEDYFMVVKGRGGGLVSFNTVPQCGQTAVTVLYTETLALSSSRSRRGLCGQGSRFVD